MKKKRTSASGRNRPKRKKKHRPLLPARPVHELVIMARAVHARLLRAGLPYLKKPETFRDVQGRRSLPRVRILLGEVMTLIREREPQTAEALEREFTNNFEQGEIKCRRRNRNCRRRKSRKRSVNQHRARKLAQERR